MGSVLILCRAICWTVVLFVLFGLMVVIANHFPCKDSEENEAKDEQEKEKEKKMIIERRNSIMSGFNHKTAAQIRKEIQENEERDALQGMDAVTEFFYAAWEEHNIEEALLKQQEATFKVLSLSFDEASMARYREEGHDMDAIDTFVDIVKNGIKWSETFGHTFDGLYPINNFIQEVCYFLGMQYESLEQFEKVSGFDIAFRYGDIVYDTKRKFFRKTYSVKQCNVYCRVRPEGV